MGKMLILEITQKTTSKNRQERDDKVALIQLLVSTTERKKGFF